MTKTKVFITLSSQASIKPVSRSGSPVFTGTYTVGPATAANKKAAHQAAPASHQSIQTTPDSISGSDTTISSDDSEDFCSSASSSSSSLPSPEIFRGESDGVCVCVCLSLYPPLNYTGFWCARLLSSSQLKHWLSPSLGQNSGVCVLTQKTPPYWTWASTCISPPTFLPSLVSAGGKCLMPDTLQERSIVSVRYLDTSRLLSNLRCIIANHSSCRLNFMHKLLP